MVRKMLSANIMSFSMRHYDVPFVQSHVSMIPYFILSLTLKCMIPDFCILEKAPNTAVCPTG